MAEVTGTPPVEYRAATELPQTTTDQTGWEVRPEWSQEEKNEGYTPVQQVAAEFIGTFLLVAVVVGSGIMGRPYQMEIMQLHYLVIL